MLGVEGVEGWAPVTSGAMCKPLPDNAYDVEVNDWKNYDAYDIVVPKVCDAITLVFDVTVELSGYLNCPDGWSGPTVLPLPALPQCPCLSIPPRLVAACVVMP